MKTKNMTTLNLTHPINRSPLRLAFLLIPLALACFALSPAALAVNPPPDGGYPGGNTAEGKNALFSLTTGTENTAVGFKALYSNTTGIENTGLGARALITNTTGSRNTAIGNHALLGSTANDNTVVGNNAGSNIVDGSGNSIIGSEAGSGIFHANGVMVIGNVPGVSSVFGEKDSSCYIQNIYNEPIGGAGVPHAVWVDADGTLGLMPSSGRFKHDIQPMDKASEVILALKPVTFKYNSDRKGRPQYGLIAEDVAEVNPELIYRDNKGQIASVRYEQINAMLLNEFLKEHRTVQELRSTATTQEATIAQLKKEFQATVAQQQKQIEALTAGLQKVSTQIEMSRPAPQTVLNNQ
jgi:uncharacterized coiled-coil protein SlyX